MSANPTSAPVPLVIDSTCVEAIDPISDQPTLDRFHFITSQQNFADGSNLCTSLLPGFGAYPASVRSDEEYSLITDLYFANFPLFVNEIESGAVRTPSLDFFMGLIDPVFNITPTNSVDRFHWIDGAPIEFGNVSGVFPWAANQPNNFETKFEGCLEYRRQILAWNDAECKLARMMLCRSPCRSPQPTTSPTIIFLEPSIAANEQAPGVSNGTIAAVATIFCILFIAILFFAYYAAKIYRKKPSDKSRFTLDIDLPTLDNEGNTMKAMGMIRLVKKNVSNDLPPLPPRERLPKGLTPLQTTLEFHDNRVSAVQITSAQHGVHAKPAVGLQAARNLLGLPPFFRKSSTTVGTEATDPSLRPPLGEARETVKTFVTRPGSAISGLTSPTVPSIVDTKPKASSNDTIVLTRLPKPPAMGLRDSKTTWPVNDRETEYDGDTVWPENNGPPDI